MAEVEASHDNPPRPEDVLLDPIRQAIGSFVSSVEMSSKEISVAAERFALDSAQLIRTASYARRKSRRSGHQARDVAGQQRAATGVNQGASEAAPNARVAAGAVSPSAQGANDMPEAEAIAATTRRLQRLEENISILTGLLREVYDRVGSLAPSDQPHAPKPTVRRGGRRFRMRQPQRQPLRVEPPAPERRFYAADR